MKLDDFLDGEEMKEVIIFKTLLASSVALEMTAFKSSSQVDLALALLIKFAQRKYIHLSNEELKEEFHEALGEVAHDFIEFKMKHKTNPPIIKIVEDMSKMGL